jgi:hypothetical protein
VGMAPLPSARRNRNRQSARLSFDPVARSAVL